MTAGAILGVIGIAVASLSCWLHVKNKDGSGWGIVAFFFLVSSCTQLKG